MRNVDQARDEDLRPWGRLRKRPQFFHLPVSTPLCHVILQQLLSRNGIYLPSPWIWLWAVERGRRNRISEPELKGPLHFSECYYHAGTCVHLGMLEGRDYTYVLLGEARGPSGQSANLQKQSLTANLPLPTNTLENPAKMRITAPLGPD